MDRALTARCGATYDDTEGLINFPLTVKGIQAVVFFKESGPGDWRISMRSKGDVNVNASPGIRRRRPQQRVGLRRQRRPRPPEAARSSRSWSTPVKARRLGPRTKQWMAFSSSTSRRASRRTTSWRWRGGRSANADRAHRHPRPLATGVLPLAIGRATRLVRFLSASDKEYDAKIRFGATTNTYDTTGETTAAIPIARRGPPSSSACSR